MLSAWQRRGQERPVPLLCPSSSHCWPHLRDYIPSSSPLPGSWHFRSRSSLRPLVPVLALSVVCVHCRFWWQKVQVFLCGVVSDIHLFFFFLFPAVIVGGIDMMSQALVLAKKPHIVIGNTTVSILSY